LGVREEIMKRLRLGFFWLVLFQMISSLGCNDETLHPIPFCDDGLTKCEGVCVDTSADPKHCGGCKIVCEAPDNARPVCINGVCSFECLPGFYDNDGNPENGCESDCIDPAAPEVCNGFDDNCNDVVDEGFECIKGSQVDCTTKCQTPGKGICDDNCKKPDADHCQSTQAEICNGQDDDCDQATDEDFDCIQSVSISAEGCTQCRVKTCTENCAWSECSGQGACSPNSHRPCGNCNLGSQTCLDDCTFGPCSGGGTCAPTSTMPCGQCGTSTCDSTCNWSGCLGEHGCRPGDSRACGYCLIGHQSCWDNCEWSACADGGLCEPNAVMSCIYSYCDASKRCNAFCDWEMCTPTASPPGNDHCGGAIDISAGGTYPGTTCGATSDWTVSTGCAARGALNSDVAYRLTLNRRSYVVLSLCNRLGGHAEFDTVLHLHSGWCDGATLACNDDSETSDCGTDWIRSTIKVTLDPGTYFAIVDGRGDFNIEAGPFTLSVTITPQ
jgi:hypothetical protein